MKVGLCLTLSILLAATIIAGSAGAESFLTFDNDGVLVEGRRWFNMDVDTIEKAILASGYSHDVVNTMGRSFGFLKFNNDALSPKQISINYGSDFKLTGLFVVYAANKADFMEYHDALYLAYGDAAFIDEETVEMPQGMLTTSERLRWSNEKYSFSMYGSEAAPTSSMMRVYDAQMGKVDFTLSVEVKHGKTLNDTIESALDVQETLKATPTPTSGVKSAGTYLHVAGAEIKKNRIGATELHVSFKNISKHTTIDRIDFEVKCYDVYGNLLRPYGRYDYLLCVWEDEPVRPNMITSNNGWMMADCDTTKSVDITIVKFHTTNGQTFDIPVDERSTIRYK